MAAAWSTGNRGFSAANVASLDTGAFTVSGSSKYLRALVFSGAATPVSATSVVLDPAGVNQAFTATEAAVVFATNFEGRPWHLIAPSDVTSKVVRATWASNQDETMVLVDLYTGVDQTTGHRTPPTPTQGNNGTPSITVTSVSGDLVVGSVCGATVNGGLTTVTSSTLTVRQKVEGTDIGGFEQCGQGDVTATGASTTASFALGNTSPPFWVLFGAALIPASGGTPVGVASETDTALALIGPPAAGVASETDRAVPIYGTNFADAGDLFLFGDDDGNESSMGGIKVFGGQPQAVVGTPPGVSVETDAALGLAGVQLRAAGIASETDAALALARVQIRSVGLAAETDAALTLTGLQQRAAGVALETDAALAAVGVQLRGAGLAAESDAALALTPGANGGVGVALETDAALALVGRQIRATGLAQESNAALALQGVQLRAAGLAAQSDSAVARTAVQLRAVGLAAEADAALALSGQAGNGVGAAAESDTAFALVAVQRLLVGAALEVDAALALQRTVARAVGTATEADAALSLASSTAKTPGIAAESDAALALTSPTLLVHGRRSQARADGITRTDVAVVSRPRQV